MKTIFNYTSFPWDSQGVGGRNDKILGGSFVTGAGMDFRRVTLETCREETGVVVVIDVIRAFTTAAFAFAAGASQIIEAGTVEEALALHAQIPGTLLMGEVGGMPIPGFDYGNSPAIMRKTNLAGKQLIQRTSSGTQGVVRSVQATHIFAAAFTTAKATAKALQELNPTEVAFVLTGLGADETLEGPILKGDEDAACADYLAALLLGGDPDVQPYLERVRRSPAGQAFTEGRPEAPIEDLEACLEANLLTFAMKVRREENRPVLHAVY